MHLNMMNETQTTKTKLSFVYGKNMSTSNWQS